MRLRRQTGRKGRKNTRAIKGGKKAKVRKETVVQMTLHRNSAGTRFWSFCFFLSHFLVALSEQMHQRADANIFPFVSAHLDVLFVFCFFFVPL